MEEPPRREPTPERDPIMEFFDTWVWPYVEEGTLWPVLLLLGLERVRIEPAAPPFMTLEFISYPYSHSLLMLAVWGVLIGGAYRGIVGGRRTVWVLCALVVSHWVLDVITHNPDMPLTTRGARLGFGLWNSLPATLLVEAALFTAGTAVYLKTTSARDRIGSAGLWALVAFLAVAYAAAVFGPPPPSARAVAIPGTAMWLLVLWAYWVDRHRTVRTR